MNTERLKTSSSLQHEVFLTQEIYNKYSCRPSFVEFLEKHLGSNKDRQTTGHNKHDDKNEDLPMESLTEGHKMNKGTNNSGAERNGSHSVPACLGSAMGFPCVSKISIESQELFLKVLEILRSSQLAKVDLQEMKAVQDIKNTVLIEQDEYQKFVHHHAKNNHHLYNFVQPDIWDTFKSEVEGKFKESVFKYPRHYSLQETIGLAVGAVFKSDAVLTFEQTLLQVGNVSKLCLPENTGIMLSEVSAVPDEKARVMTSAAVKSNSPKVVSEDPIAVSLAKKHKADIVISSSGLNTLLNNQPPDYRRQWQLPITVQRLQGNQDKSLAHKVVFIDKPLPPQQVNPREVNMKYYKHVFRKLVCQKPGGENAATDGNTARDTNLSVKTTDGSHSAGLERERKTSEMNETVSVNGKRRVSQEGDEIAAIKKSKVTDSSEKESVSASKTEGQKFFVYNLWRFGKLKVLIRCSVDAYRTEPNKEKCYTFFSVLPKLEYQPNFGHEKLTYSEAARLWLHGYIRPNTKLICGRINVYSSELLRVDELFINDILQQGTGFHPAQGMKIVFQVFQALKRLSEGKFILSHKSGEIHGCLYKSIQANSSSLKSSCDLHKTRTPVIVNYSEAEIPWVPIDCNLFMPWQVRERRIPCTFPPVPAIELEQMTKKAKEAAAKGAGKNKKKKKKGKKKGKGKGPAPTASSVSEQAKTTRNERRTVNKEKLFASFYDTQTVEKESEVFAVSRRASGPVSYDDLDF